MRREGRQHGMVRTYPILSSPWNPRPKPGSLNEISSRPTAGLFNKVSRKPTNHSKFTGKCGRSMCRDCHIYPAAGKSKDKSKGGRKVRSLSDQSGLITWRVVDPNPGSKFIKPKITMLDYLASDDDDFVDRDIDYEIGYMNDCAGVEELYDNNEVSFDQIKEIADCEFTGVDNDDQFMSFYEVGSVWQPVDEDEGWCLVEGM